VDVDLVRRWPNLTADEQARAVQFQVDQLGVDPSIATDPAIAPKLNQLATARAKQAFYLEPDDRLVSLPPPPPPTTTTP
jgi:hypothetical protein